MSSTNAPPNDCAINGAFGIRTDVIDGVDIGVELHAVFWLCLRNELKEGLWVLNTGLGALPPRHDDVDE